ncbi:catalase family protein [Paracoccus luteus]|uniref:catalase family protein n=1 Tax=Paracoccus luteus TaxID=2508543 RepID=UPI00106F2A6B|nr:catalase family protein [Paracoccus luteus]
MPDFVPPDLAPPVRFSPDVEKVQPDEDEVARKIAEQMRYIIDRTHKVDGHAVRSVHAKSHAILQATLRIHEGLAPELAQGIFAAPGDHQALVRISTIPGDVLRDSVSLPRGIAIKVFGVQGDRLPGSEGETTQDFLMAGGPVFSVPTAKAFLGNLKPLALTTERAEWAKAALSAVLRPVERAIEAVGLKSAALGAFGGYQPTNPLGESYFTQVPLRHGDHIAKLRVVPASASFRALSDDRIDLDDPDAIRAAVIAALAGQGGAWTVEVQLCRDLDTMPVEDASVEWPEEQSPFQPVATLTVPAQQAWSAERSAIVDETIAFRPWRGIEAHRPLGNVMRARRHVYPVAAAHRSALTGCPIHEPQRLPDLG